MVEYQQDKMSALYSEKGRQEYAEILAAFYEAEIEKWRLGDRTGFINEKELDAWKEALDTTKKCVGFGGDFFVSLLMFINCFV